MKIKVGVLFGGWGEEREVSVKSGQFVVENLDRNKYEVREVLVNRIEDIIELKGEIDLAFIAFHGKIGEGGYVQAILDLLGIPYTSASPLPSQIGMNKWLFKRVLQSEGLTTVSDIVLDYVTKRILVNENGGYRQVLSRICLRQTVRLIAEKWSYPVFVKPADSGSSFGISKVKNESQLRPAVKEATKFSRQVIIEPSLEGKELTVTFVGKTVLPPILIIPHKGEFFDYASKYEEEGAEEICPAPIDSKLSRRLQRLTLKIKKVVGVETYGRVDFVYKPDEDVIYPLEINTVPGMTTTSLVPKAAAAFGWSNQRLLDEIIRLVLPEQNHTPEV